MARKIEPQNPQFTTFSAAAPTAAPAAAGRGEVQVDASPMPVSKQKAESIADKNVEIEKLSKEISRFAAENSQLKDSLAEYIAELEKTRHDLAIANDALVIEKAKHDPDKLVMNVQPGQVSENEKKLQEENDKYLMKISELSFDKARLEEQLKDAERKLGAAESRSKQPVQPGFAVPPRQNGYDSWN